MGRRIDALPASPIDQRSEALKFRFNLLMLNGCSCIGGFGVRGTPHKESGSGEPERGEHFIRRCTFDYFKGGKDPTQ
jgi:hypothetical protein